MLIFNSSPAVVGAALVFENKKKGTKKVKTFSFAPGKLVNVERDEWEKLKEIPLIARKLESGALSTGSKARSSGKEAEAAIKEAEEKEAEE